MTATAKKKSKRRSLKTTFAAAKKRTLVAKKIAAESTLRVVPIPQRIVSEPKDEDDDRDERKWLDW
jgi:hypothetical protein